MKKTEQDTFNLALYSNEKKNQKENSYLLHTPLFTICTPI